MITDYVELVLSMSKRLFQIVKSIYGLILATHGSAHPHSPDLFYAFADAYRHYQYR